jgi:hypothetical protein
MNLTLIAIVNGLLVLALCTALAKVMWLPFRLDRRRAETQPAEAAATTPSRRAA